MSRRCEICETQEARFVCSRCGRRVCLKDFQQGRWLCTACEPSIPTDASQLRTAPPTGVSWIFFVSFALIFLGMVVMMIASAMQTQGPTSGGTVILIGPIPIVLGNGPESYWLILLAAIITAISLATFLFAHRKTYQ